VVVPRGGKGLEPLHTFYSRACLGSVRAALSEGGRRVVEFFDEVRVVEVGEEELSQVEDYEESFFNVNTLGEYERAVELMRRLGK
jgi:molybdopterin-guanine dinucleotide biosynthesis protein A